METFKDEGELIKCVKTLVMEERYEEALEEFDYLDIGKIKNMSVLCLLGEVYMGLGRYDDAESVLLRVYEKDPGTRRILELLTTLYIDKEEYSEAEFYYKEFIGVASRDVHRYILRYRLDKGKGERLSVLIDTLEKLKDYEYIEEWAYELATLYEADGQTQKCIHECDEMILWFGYGEYVDKAIALKCKLTGDPLPEISTVRQHEEEELAGEESADSDDEDTGEDASYGFEDSLDLDLIGRMTDEQDRIRRIEEDEEEEEEEKEDVPDLEKILAQEKAPAEEKAETEEKTGTKDEEAGEEEDDASSFFESLMFGESSDDAVKGPGEGFVEDNGDEDEDDDDAEDYGAESAAKEHRYEYSTEAVSAEDLDEEGDEISDNIMASDTVMDIFGSVAGVKSIKDQLEKTFTRFEEAGGEQADLLAPYDINFVVTGYDMSVKSQIAIGIAKALNTYGVCDRNKLVRATADDLNSRDFSSIFDKMKGGCLIIERAGDLGDAAAGIIADFVQKEGQDVAIVLEGEEDDIRTLFGKYPVFASKFLNVIHIAKYNENELVQLAVSYAKTKGYELSRPAAMMLKRMLRERMRDDYSVNYEDLIAIIDEAVSNLEKRNMKNLFMTVLDNKYEEASMFMLQPEDFDNIAAPGQEE